MEQITKEKIDAFQKKVFEWWKKHKRDLPWRKTTNPYFIMVSEIMLQQTQVNRSIDKYYEFLDNFPTLEVLAKANTADVLKVWSGLGYNRRAIWLQEAAKKIIEKGYFPKTSEELIRLKGIGKYTSRSILIFAFNEDLAAVDTNIRRILIAEGFAEENTTEKELFEIAEKIVPKSRSRDWHNALMDYGSLKLTSAKTGIKPITTQPKFKKSRRFFRGKIVKLLTERNSLTYTEIESFCKIKKEKLDDIIQSLIKDQLIVEEKEKRYSLPK